MDTSGEAADLVVKESIQLTEASIKLLAAGSKNLAAFLYAFEEISFPASFATKPQEIPSNIAKPVTISGAKSFETSKKLPASHMSFTSALVSSAEAKTRLFASSFEISRSALSRLFCGR